MLRRVSTILLTIALGIALGATMMRAANPTEDETQPVRGYTALGKEVVRVVEDNFLDTERAQAWAERHADYASGIGDVETFASRTNEILGELETSHTHYYPRGTVAYWGLLAIFGDFLGVEHVEYESIGADISDGRFVRRVLAGGAAELAGLLRGDRIVAVNGRPYDPVDTFAGTAGTEVTLQVERSAGEPVVELTVVPRSVNPRDEWLRAQREGARVISRDGVGVAYVPLLWCVGDDVEELMQELIAERFVNAAALVLDFRDGWGGCNPDFLNYFNTVPPVLTLIDRDGKRRSHDPQWRKPLYVLINGGSRSGKEVVAWAVQRHAVGTLVGTRTAGFVVGGRPYLLSDESLLYVAVMDSLVDGERLEGIGVTPDVVVPDGLEFAAGADPQLERAVELAAERPLTRSSPRR